MASPCHCSPYLWELAPGDLGGPVALDHDGGIHFPGSLGAGGLIKQVIVGFVAGVQASLPEFLVQPGVWGQRRIIYRPGGSERSDPLRDLQVESPRGGPESVRWCRAPQSGLPLGRLAPMVVLEAQGVPVPNTFGPGLSGQIRAVRGQTAWPGPGGRVGGAHGTGWGRECSTVAVQGSPTGQVPGSWWLRQASPSHMALRPRALLLLSWGLILTPSQAQACAVHRG